MIFPISGQHLLKKREICDTSKLNHLKYPLYIFHSLTKFQYFLMSMLLYTWEAIWRSPHSCFPLLHISKAPAQQRETQSTTACSSAPFLSADCTLFPPLHCQQDRQLPVSEINGASKQLLPISWYHLKYQTNPVQYASSYQHLHFYPWKSCLTQNKSMQLC